MFVVTFGLGFEVPFADEKGLVAGFLKFFRVLRGVLVDRTIKPENAIGMAVLPCQNRRATGRADRVVTGKIIKPYALFGNAIDGRSFGEILEITVVSGDRLEGMIVHENDDHVRAWFARFCEPQCG